MGLDMYAYAVDHGKLVNPAAQTDLEFDEPNPTQIAYWRKFNHLHGWMHDLYTAKGGVSGDFNCNTVRLEEADLAQLEKAVETGPLPSRAGFFFGGSEWQEGDKDEVLEFIGKARAQLNDGKVVFYDSWW